MADRTPATVSAVARLEVWTIRVWGGVSGATGLPGIANRATGTNPYSLHIGPGEWLLYGTDGAVPVAPDLEGHVHHSARTSAGWAGFRIGGAGGRALLATGCSLDTDPRHFGPGHCARTLLDRLPVLLHRPSAEPGFTVLVDASLGPDLGAWLAAATAAAP